MFVCVKRGLCCFAAGPLELQRFPGRTNPQQLGLGQSTSSGCSPEGSCGQAGVAAALPPDWLRWEGSGA